MKLFKITLFVALFCVSGAMARPASPFVKKSVQSDGSTLGIRSLGDEHYHFTETSDGLLIERDSSGDFVYVNSDGSRSAVKAKDPSLRDSAERAFIAGIDQAAARSGHKGFGGGRFPEQDRGLDFVHTARYTYNAAAPTFVKHNRLKGESWAMGERYFPILLISTPSKAAVDSATVWRYFNEKGYTDSDGNIASVRDFYLESSNGKFSPHFDVFPIKLSKDLAQYVVGDSLSENSLTTEGIDLLVKRPDFDAKKYCSGSNKVVDGFFYLFPGREDEALPLNQDFWAHQFWMQANGANNRYRQPYGYEASNKYIFDKYVLAAQKEDDDRYGKVPGNMNKMGIFIHEFAHVLGMSDHYGEKPNGEEELGASAYDLMSLGMYNVDGRVPAKFNAFEREAMGWMTLTELASDTGTIMLDEIDKGQAYSVTNPSNTDEYFIVEYRPSKGFDTGITRGQARAYNGVWVWYVYYEEKAWRMNNVNGMDGFNRMDIKASLVNGSNSSKSSYSPMVYKSGAAAPLTGVYNFVKSGDSLVCFTLDASTTVKECARPESSSMMGTSSAAEESSSSVAQSSSSSEALPPSSSAVASSSSVVPESSTAVISPSLDVAAGSETHFFRIFDMQGRPLYSGERKPARMSAARVVVVEYTKAGSVKRRYVTGN